MALLNLEILKTETTNLWDSVFSYEDWEVLYLEQWLKDDERLDYLLAEDLRIIQSPSVFSFSLDAVLLSRFVSVPLQKGNIVDLCSGNGVIPLFLSARTKANIIGVEIQERLYDMAVRSIKYNKLEQQISMVHGDVKEIPPTLGIEKYDVVTCNQIGRASCRERV